MQVARSLDQPLTDRSVVLTIGRFDGVHLGHQQLITTAIDQAKKLGFVSAVLTWEPHPNSVIRPDQPLHLLTSLEERIELIGALNPDVLVVAPFTRETMATPAEAYMGQICHALPLRELWVGEDFAMGRGREGDIPRLMEIGTRLGYAVGTVRKVEVASGSVSSSRVRQLLLEGDVEGVQPLLGRAFSLQGLVVEGDKRGRTIGFPTANLAIDQMHVLPANGVYSSRVLHGSTWLPAVTNIGVRPTFAGLHRTVETHLLDWSGDLYGQTLRIAFLHRLRGEQKFNGIAELVAQIQRDADQARRLLASGE
ncbi:MAG: bifunctional riboflavin kinase/FAD synthetase [Chloroflexaceae bacterium]|nr:bifunctional riboflavin kinase/FAD synthetase [Chloroflexaceae bacterium]